MSRVLNGVGPVAERTKRKVLQAAEELNYVPNAIARSFARGKSGNVGVVLPYVPKVQLFHTFYFAQILSGIGEAVNRRGYDLLLLFQTGDSAYDYTHPFRTHKIDACIILGAKDSPEERSGLSALEEQQFPFCLVSQQFERLHFSNVDAAHEDGSEQAVTHLLQQGFQRIAFINGPLEFSNSVDRLKGYEAALCKAGLSMDERRIFSGNYSRKSGYEAAEAIHAGIRSGDIDAVFAANDRMAVGLSIGLKERGLTAGMDYALVGYDNDDISRYCDPPLTTVQVPFFEMGVRAASLLLERLEDPADALGAPFSERLPTELIIRETSRIHQ